MRDLTRNIFIMIHEDPFNSSAILRGCGEYAMRHTRWHYTVFHDGPEALPGALARARCDGAIVLVHSDEIARRVRHTGIPAVNLINAAPQELIPAVRPDDYAAGRLAAEHLVVQGFRRVAFYGCDQPWSLRRYEAFCKTAAGRATVQSNARNGRFPAYHLADRQQSYSLFIRQLSYPAAVYACNDGLAANLLSVAVDAGIGVPDQLAVIGTDNVERHCMFGKVQLSSIDLDVSLIAYRGAELLDHLMAGERAPVSPILVPPRGLFARRSTDQLAYEDATVASAMRYIRQHATDKLTVEALLQEVNVSRSWLERKFMADVGRSPGQEIRRQRLERARELLRSTSMPLAAIADVCGFDYLSHFSMAFKRQYGQTPSGYRAVAGAVKGA